MLSPNIYSCKIQELKVLLTRSGNKFHWYNDPIDENELYSALHINPKVRESVTGVTTQGSTAGYGHKSIFF